MLLLLSLFKVAIRGSGQDFGDETSVLRAEFHPESTFKLVCTVLLTSKVEWTSHEPLQASLFTTEPPAHLPLCDFVELQPSCLAARPQLFPRCGSAVLKAHVLKQSSAALSPCGQTVHSCIRAASRASLLQE